MPSFQQSRVAACHVQWELVPKVSDVCGVPRVVFQAARMPVVGALHVPDEPPASGMACVP